MCMEEHIVEESIKYTCKTALEKQKEASESKPEEETDKWGQKSVQDVCCLWPGAACII